MVKQLLASQDGLGSLELATWLFVSFLLSSVDILSVFLTSFVIIFLCG
jgi:hypothetical protein